MNTNEQMRDALEDINQEIDSYCVDGQSITDLMTENPPSKEDERWDGCAA